MLPPSVPACAMQPETVFTAAGAALSIPNLCDMAHLAGLEIDPDIMYQVGRRQSQKCV